MYSLSSTATVKSRKKVENVENLVSVPQNRRGGVHLCAGVILLQLVNVSSNNVAPNSSPYIPAPHQQPEAMLCSVVSSDLQHNNTVKTKQQIDKLLLASY